jgi:hypothetical protein
MFMPIYPEAPEALRRYVLNILNAKYPWDWSEEKPSSLINKRYPRFIVKIIYRITSFTLTGITGPIYKKDENEIELYPDEWPSPPRESIVIKESCVTAELGLENNAVIENEICSMVNKLMPVITLYEHWGD